jgi:hypothetical protein
MKDFGKRIRRIERDLDIEGKTQWLRIPDPAKPGETIEVKGCRTLADFLKGYKGQDESE